METLKLMSYGFGLACGLAWALIITLVWTAVAGPIQEYLTERFLDPRRKSHETPLGASGPPTTGSLSVLVSDLHLDFWDYSGFGDQKLPQFQAFLKHVAANPRVKRFYLNGDLMDLPTHPNHFPAENAPIQLDSQGNVSFFLKDSRIVPGSLQPEFDQVLSEIGALSRTMVGRGDYPCIFLTGNHDIGINGLRFARKDQSFWPAQIAWGPSVIYRATDRSAVYIEHGHLVDPFLWLYLRYALLDLTRVGIQSVMQRGGRTGMGKKTDTRKMEMFEMVAAGVYDEKLYGWPSTEREKSPQYRDKPIEWLARHRYRHAARRRFRELGGSKGTVKVVTFGHTHIPDCYRFPGGLTYLNSGDWSIDTPHCCFSLIDDDGNIHGPYQWPFDKDKI
ncbi:MAG: metallophosphoesterase [Fimbriimonadaceae bacterium]|nr:metallophosphoesterase [Fimbriimonadaceae bacterium]